MKLKNISQCARGFDFNPRLAWPKALPAIAFCGELVSGFDLAPEHPVIDWYTPEKNLSWSQFFKSIHPELTLPELARLQKCISINSHILNQADILSEYHLRPSENLNRILEIILQLTTEQQAWLSEKKMSTQDLMIFLAAPVAVTAEALSFVIENNLSKSQAVSALEYLCELKLSNKVDDFNSLSGKNADETLQKIKNLRYSNTIARDQEREKKLNLPWPAPLEPQLIRRGDRSGFEFKLFVSNPVELKKYIQGLERVVQEWKE